eukprot:TRINITY_DN4327_c0_g1_i1.p1 TRINITY_DN4327_c0_g1~~TRINITY_DN4327_c0_g1_i1.p1  ORF type:complete len:321 (+),score=33.59 TRINITY_DN4327_c0_g1_i1:10-972(+)
MDKLSSLYSNWEKYISGDMGPWKEYLYQKKSRGFVLVKFVDQLSRGFAQVMFSNNPISGIIIFIALFVGDPYLACMSLLGCVFSTGNAWFLGTEIDDIKNGLYGFNGVLVGAAFSVFVGDTTWGDYCWVYLVMYASFSTIIQLSIRGIFQPYELPCMTLPFNTSLIMMFLAYVSFNNVYLRTDLDIGNPTYRLDNIDYTIKTVYAGIIYSFSQVFLVQNLISGVLIAVAVFIYKPQAYISGQMGAIIGVFTAMIMGVSAEQIEYGLWGYNSILSAMAIFPVFIHASTRSFIMAIYCAVFTVFIQASTVGLFINWGMLMVC